MKFLQCFNLTQNILSAVLTFTLLCYQIDPSAVKQGAATTSEGVLANFFNSLLSKKTGGLAGGQPGPVGPGASPGGGPPGNYIIYLSVPALALPKRMQLSRLS